MLDVILDETHSEIVNKRHLVDIRNIQIEYDIVGEYGYQLETETFDMFLMDDDDEFEIEKEESLELDQDELISFLNEYFTINPDKVPPSSIF